jgi:hypothetical protein
MESASGGGKKMKASVPMAVVLALLSAPGVLPAAELPSDHAKPVRLFVDREGRLRPVLRLPEQELSLFSLVDAFLGEVLDNFRMGDANLRALWERLEVQPDSPQARSIMKAAFRAKAMLLDLPPIPLDASDKEFQDAQIRNYERRVRELRGVYVQLLRELKSTSYPVEELQTYLETRVRPSMSRIYFGEPSENDRKIDVLERSFAEGLAEEVGESADAAGNKQ